MKKKTGALANRAEGRGATHATRIERLELLLTVAKELTSILDLDLLLKRVSSLIKGVIPYEHFALLLYDEDSKELIWEFGIGYSSEARQRLERISVSRGLVGRALRTRSSVISLDVSEEPDFLPAETESGAKIRSALATPLVHHDRVVGVMTLESTRLAEFTEEQEQILSALASILATAVDNASLYQASQRDAATKELLFEISREMGSILDLHVLLDKIADLLERDDQIRRQVIEIREQLYGQQVVVAV